jgi:hypothetical protein
LVTNPAGKCGLLAVDYLPQHPTGVIHLCAAHFDECLELMNDQKQIDKERNIRDTLILMDVKHD